MSLRKPSKQARETISSRCREFITLSRRYMEQRYAKWRENEEAFMAYIPQPKEEVERISKSDSPTYSTIYVPFSYAIALTAHTYYTSVFLARNPVFQVTGRHGESEMQIQAMEALLDYQLNVGQMLPPLFFWLLDPIKYGVGFIGSYWDEETVRCRKWVKKPATFAGVPIPGTEELVEEVVDTVGYQGHRVFNVRPQDAFPDPRVPIWNFQNGEFFARYIEISKLDYLEGVELGRYFQIDFEEKADSFDFDRDLGSTLTVLPGSMPFDEQNILRGYEVFVKIIPRDWHLADSNRKEIWVFYVTANSFEVFGAQPLGEYHGKFPFDVLIHEPEAYGLFSRSMMEIMQPVNDTITWLVNSHMYNVRAALNNMFIYDPSMVVSQDLENPEPGKLIRLKPHAYGRDVRSVISQFQVADVTTSHIPNMQLMMDMLQRMTGVNDNIMGLVNTGGRKTATEVRQSTTLGINRLKTVCEFFSAIGFSPLAQKLIQGTQQHYTVGLKLRIVGDLASFSGRFIEVAPDMISGFYDFVPVDGTLPVDRFAQANLWQTMVAQLSKVPQIAGQYDLGKIFAWVASLAGLKNVQAFKIQAAPPDVLQQEAAKGNLAVLDRPPDQMQIPNLGATA